MVREPLQVGVGMSRDGNLSFRALRPDTAGQVPLGALLTAEDVGDVLGAADVQTADIIQKLRASGTAAQRRDRTGLPAR